MSWVPFSLPQDILEKFKVTETVIFIVEFSGTANFLKRNLLIINFIFCFLNYDSMITCLQIWKM